MYNLNYTYLIELQVDTRQTYSDLSDDLMLVNCYANENPETQTVEMDTLISSWQDFFWKSDNINKQNLNVVFTDLSIEHGSDSSTDFSGVELSTNEMMNIKEFNEVFAQADRDKIWCGNKTFTELCSTLVRAIDKLQNKWLDDDKLHAYPIGSIVVSENIPGTGSWKMESKSYLSENMGSETQNAIEPGFNDGKASGVSVGTNIQNIQVKPNIKKDKNNKPLIPVHEHKLEFIPKEKVEAQQKIITTSKDTYATYAYAKKGMNEPRTHKYGESHYSGRVLDPKYKNPETIGAVIRKDSNYPCEKSNSSVGEFTITSASVKAENNNGVKVAPKTYPLNANVWERVNG